MNNKLKGIFINLFLACAMVLSVIGGAILMTPSINAKVRAENITLGKPANLKFTAAKTQAQAASYDNVNGFVYQGSQLNYVEIKDVIYYYKTGTYNKLYTHPTTHNSTTEAEDITIISSTEESGKRYFTVKLNGSDAEMKCEVINSIYITTHNDIRYYLKTDGNLYNNMSADRPTEDLVYSVQYGVSADEFDDCNTSLQESIINGAGGYYKLTTQNYYVKKGVKDKLYNASGNEVTLTELNITPLNILVHNLHTTPKTDDNINIYTTLTKSDGSDPVKHYIYNGHLYTTPVFYQLTNLPDNINPQTDGVEVKYAFTGNKLTGSDELYEVIINDNTYYALKNGTALYNSSITQVNPTQFSLVAIDNTNVTVKYPTQNANSVNSHFFIDKINFNVDYDDSKKVTINSDTYHPITTQTLSGATTKIDSSYYVKKTDGSTLDTDNLYVFDGSTPKVVLESGFKIKSIAENKVVLMDEYYCINNTVCKKKNQNKITYNTTDETINSITYKKVESMYNLNGAIYYISGTDIYSIETLPKEVDTNSLTFKIDGNITVNENITFNANAEVNKVASFTHGTFNYYNIKNTNYYLKQDETGFVLYTNSTVNIATPISPNDPNQQLFHIQTDKVNITTFANFELGEQVSVDEDMFYKLSDEIEGSYYGYNAEDGGIYEITTDSTSAELVDNFEGYAYTTLTISKIDGTDYLPVLLKKSYDLDTNEIALEGSDEKYQNIKETEYYVKKSDATNIYLIDGNNATAINQSQFLITSITDSKVIVAGATSIDTEDFSSFDIDSTNVETEYGTLYKATITVGGTQNIYVLKSDPQKRYFNITTGNNPVVESSGQVTINTPPVDAISTEEVNLTFTLPINLSTEQIAETKKYYKINIFNAEYYVVLGASNKLFTFTGGSQVATKLGSVRNPFSSITIGTNTITDQLQKTNNGSEVLNTNYYNIEHYGYYYVNGFNVYKLTSQSLNTSFINFNGTYYYKNAKLYIKADTSSDSNLVQDFTYTPHINQVLINSTYNNIETAEFNYVEIDGIIYYVDGQKLYTSVTIGNEDKIKYNGEVTNNNIGYNIDSTFKYISLFSSTTYSEIQNFTELNEAIEKSGVTLTHTTKINNIQDVYVDGDGKIYSYDGTTATLIDVKSVYSNINIALSGYVIKDDTYYYVDKNNELYRLYNYADNKYYAAHYSLININYSATITGTTFTVTGDTQDTLHVNKINATINSPQAEDKLYNAYISNIKDPVPFKNDGTVNDGNITVRYAVIYNDTTSSIEVYLHPKGGTTSNSYGMPYEDIATFLIDYKQYKIMEISKSVDGKTTNSDSYSNYFISSDKRVYFSNSYRSYESGDSFGAYAINDTNKTLINSTTSLDYTQENFYYSVVSGAVNVLAKQSFTLSGSKRTNLGFNVEVRHLLKDHEYEYFTSNRKDYIVGVYEDSTIGIYESIVFNHVAVSNEPSIPEGGINELDESLINNIELFAEEVAVHYQAINYKLQSTISATYQLHESLASTKFEDGSIVMLDNFNTKSALINNSGGTNNVNLVYIGFNERLTGSSDSINSGVVQLTVQGFLKNDYVMRFRNISSSYDDEYGINININSPIQESVEYTSQVGHNVNYYWYQHLDLTGLEANIDYSLNDDQDGQIKLEKIEDPSGLYTFIFDFTYVNGAQTTVYKYVYSFYLIESSDYIEYPTFNTLLSENTDSIKTTESYSISRSSFISIEGGTNAGTYYALVGCPYYVKNGSDKLFKITPTGENSYIVSEFADALNVRDDLNLTPISATSISVNFTLRYRFNEIIEDITEISSSANISYAYNNQHFDKPVYIYDASKYNVSYDFKYNLEGHKYTTEFEIHNPGTNSEFGILKLFNDGALLTTYRLEITKLDNSEFAVDYYVGAGKDYLYGSIYVNIKGNYYLSLEDYYYYNDKNFADYVNPIDYYSNGRLVKNGAENTPATYVMTFLFDEIGDYTFINKYLISQGNATDVNIATFRIDDQTTVDTLQGKYTFSGNFVIDGQNATSMNFTNGSISRFASYNVGTGDFVLESGVSAAKATGVFSNKTSNPTLKIYGISTTFIKNAIEIPFRKLDENILSDITPNKTFNGATAGTTIDAKNNLIDLDYKGLISFDNNYKVPLTNLQPIYFTYFGDFIYNESFYVRYQNCSYTIDDFGNLVSVDFSKSIKTTVQFTNKTSISSSGFYIVKVVYRHTAYAGNNQTQYFMFAIDNSAPKLEIYTKTDSMSAGQLFISNTEFTQTSKYTNKDMIYASWDTPTYFQGDIGVSYQRRSYDGSTILETVDNYNKEQIISTTNSQYVFTISYGVNKISKSSMHIIVDKTTPSGDLYSTTLNTDGSYNLNTITESRLFSEPVTFATNKIKTESGAKVYSRLLTISLNSYSDFAKAILNGSSVDAITTNIEINANSSLFDTYSRLDNSPTYNYFDKEEVAVGTNVNKSQLIGLSNQPVIYILKLYDEAGNSQIYYFIYDTSLPYVLYKLTNESELRTSFEDNTTQYNTDIIWGNYKAIPIINSDSENELYNGLINAISTNSKYNGAKIASVDGQQYLYIPINSTMISTSFKTEDRDATTSINSNFTSKATIFIEKYIEDDLIGEVKSANPMTSFIFSEGTEGSININSSNYADFFIGSKYYKFKITDAAGNELSKRLSLNSSFALEKFFGEHKSGNYELASNQPYNISKLTTRFKALSEQSFRANMAYDYYNIDFENYLTLDNTNNIDNNYSAYSQIGYDLQNNVVYMFNSNGLFVERIYSEEQKTYVPKYDYNVPEEQQYYYTYEQILQISRNNFYIPGYPYVLSSTDVKVDTNADGDEYLLSNTIYNENGETKTGLYVFKRTYIDNATGKEITQSDINNPLNVNYEVLKNDSAVKYYIYYVDRNQIIDLSYDASGNIDIINSIGDMLQIYLGQDREGNRDPVIDAEILSSESGDSIEGQQIVTNKLKAITNFTLDKYATKEKLKKYANYVLAETGSTESINNIGEQTSITRNLSTFKYFVTITHTEQGRIIVEDNTIKDSNLVSLLSDSDPLKKLFSLFNTGLYTIKVKDNSFVEDENGVKVENSENSFTFQFSISHSSPEGGFITLLDDDTSIKEINVKDTEYTSNGTVKLFESSSVENLSFRFSDSATDYDATIDPYKIVVERYTYGNNSGETIFSTKYKSSTNYYGTFGVNESSINSTRLVQILQIFDKNGNDIWATKLDEGAPYTYQINIYNKNNNNLLSDYSKDYVYAIKLEFMGNNASDYNADGKNYFSTTFKIHIDRTAPQYNLNSLISSDNNFNFYCMEKYGATFDQLDATKRQEIINTYAFPVKYITEQNIPHYYAKDNLNADFSILTESNKQIERNRILSTYSTIFHQDEDHNDSKNLYFQRIGNNLKDYKFSILPSDPAYNEGGSYQDHPRFNQSSQRYTLANYTQNQFEFSRYLEESIGGTDPVFSNAYYEVIEEDEAGNLSRYLIYASDNTHVDFNFRYYNSNKDNIVDESSGNIKEDVLFFIHNNETLYVRPCTPQIANSSGYALYRRTSDSLNTFEKISSGELTNADITFKYYYHSNDEDVVTIPTSVTRDGIKYNLQSTNNGNTATQLNGYSFFDQDYANENPLNCLNISSLHFMLETESGAEDEFLFDEFFTIRIFQDNIEALRFVNDPYNQDQSTHAFLQRITRELRELIKNSPGVYSYKIEIVNRMGYNNYTISFNLPDQELLLKFTNPTTDTLTVEIPKASEFVKLVKFEAYVYDEMHKVWRIVTTDSLKKPIQTSNDNGLSETTYTFEAGQYKFITLDNFGRGNGANGNGEYKIVGKNIDETYSFAYSRSHIVDSNGTTITSGSASLLINNNIYQIRAILKNAVRLDVTDASGNITGYRYFTLISEGEGNVTKLYRYDNNSESATYGKYLQQYLSGTAIVDDADGNKQIYYNRGRLFSDVNYKNEIIMSYTNAEGKQVNGLLIYLNTPTQLVYKLGNTIDSKTFLTFDAVCENNIAEYQIEIAWTTEPNNKYIYKLKIDKNLPNLILLNQSGSLAAVENQNYNKPFTISWTSNYRTTAVLKRTVGATTTTIAISAGDNYEINIIAGYTLTITDEIGNQRVFNFNYVKNANEYFSVIVNQIEILPSEYVSTFDGKTIKWYYYDSSAPEGSVIVKTDETKNIGKVAAEAGTTNYDYKIIRTNLDDYIICYVKLIPVTTPSTIDAFVSSIQFEKADGTKDTPIETTRKVAGNKIEPNDQFEFDYIKNQEFQSFTINVNKNLMGRILDNKYNLDYVGNKIFVDHYYNNEYVRTYSSDSWSKINGSNFESSTFPITISSTGVHRFEFRDSIGNEGTDIQITLIKDIMFTANDENPINYRIFNSEVVLNVPNTTYYNNITVKATLNGKEINTAEVNNGSKYTFTEAGYYEVIMSATAQSVGDDPDDELKQYESIYRFTIINPNVTKMTFGFSNNYGFTISKVVKNQADITNQIIAESRDSMWLTSGNEDAIGTYTITLMGYDKLSNEYLPFTFVVKLNNETPTITSTNYVFGSKTTKSITLQFNAKVIYSQVGESYIRIVGDNGIDEKIEINAESEDILETVNISKNGKYRVTIYNKDGIFITSYFVHKAAPLNASAKIIIVVVSLVIIALAVTFIVLRRHTKFR